MTENTNILETVRAWADIVEIIWRDKIIKLNILNTYALGDSLMHKIGVTAGDIPREIDFSFNYYGKFVDMGVGKGTKLGDVSENKVSRRLEGKNKGNLRRAKPWYASTMWAERKELTKILAEKYAHRASILIVENIDDNAERYLGTRI